MIGNRGVTEKILGCGMGEVTGMVDTTIAKLESPLKALGFPPEIQRTPQKNAGRISRKVRGSTPNHMIRIWCDWEKKSGLHIGDIDKQVRQGF